MIRLSYPAPPAHPFRLHLELAARRTRQLLQQRRRRLRAERAVVSFSHSDMNFSQRRLQAFDNLPTFHELYEEYDALIGLLCVAANEGIRPEHEAEYRTRRVWFTAHYPKVKDIVGAYLDKADDTAPTFLGRRRPCDAFEALFLPPTIAVMLQNDNGELIGRFLRTQDALENWGRSFPKAA